MEAVKERLVVCRSLIGFCIFKCERMFGLFFLLVACYVPYHMWKKRESEDGMLSVIFVKYCVYVLFYLLFAELYLCVCFPFMWTISLHSCFDVNQSKKRKS